MEQSLDASSSSLEELEQAYPDLLISSGQARELLKALFPKKVSRIWGIE